MANKYINETVPNYPLAIEPINSLPFDLPKVLADILDGVYTTSDAGEAATLAASRGWIIVDVVWGEHPETWVLGSLKNPG